LREKLTLFARVCEAVQYAHRNLKTSNILVTSNGDVKLLDLGIGPPSVRFEAIDQTTNQPVASNWAVNGLAPATGV
jgi:serine/threonine protein kinase